MMYRGPGKAASRGDPFVLGEDRYARKMHSRGLIIQQEAWSIMLAPRAYTLTLPLLLGAGKCRVISEIL
jgi:hypothetical protein